MQIEYTTEDRMTLRFDVITYNEREVIIRNLEPSAGLTGERLDRTLQHSVENTFGDVDIKLVG